MCPCEFVPASPRTLQWFPPLCTALFDIPLFVLAAFEKNKKKTLVGFVFVIKRRGGLRICVLKENESESPALGLFFLQIKARVQRGCEYLTRICSFRSALASLFLRLHFSAVH